MNILYLSRTVHWVTMKHLCMLPRRNVLVAMFWNTFIYKHGSKGTTFAPWWQSVYLAYSTMEVDARLSFAWPEQQVKLSKFGWLDLCKCCSWFSKKILILLWQVAYIVWTPLHCWLNYLIVAGIFMEMFKWMLENIYRNKFWSQGKKIYKHSKLKKCAA